MKRKIAQSGSVLFLAVALVGCSGGPGAIPKPTVDAQGASTAAFELYDADGDGFIAGEELTKAVGIKAGLSKVDSNGDGKVSPEELVARIVNWNASQLSILPLTCGVKLDGVPLDGATVVFEPEPFLTETLRPGEGLSNAMGAAGVSIPKENRLVENSPPGMQIGYYIVRISKQQNGKEMIPAKYNTESILGQEVAYDDPAYQSQIVYNIVTK